MEDLLLAEHLEELRVAENLKGYKSAIASLRRSVDHEAIKFWEGKLPPEWRYILRHGQKTYSGLSVAGLASLLSKSLYRWYRTVYSVQSRVTHGTDIERNLRMSEGGRAVPAYNSEVHEVTAALHVSTAMLLANIETMHQYFPFDRKFDKLIERFATRHNRVF